MLQGWLTTAWAGAEAFRGGRHHEDVREVLMKSVGIGKFPFLLTCFTL